MPSYVICPNCPKNVPTKYKKRKERKEILDPICNACTNKNARKKYEEGVKKGIWMKRFDRANKKLTEASTEFQKANDPQASHISNIMSMLSGISLNPPVNEVLNYFSRLLSTDIQETFHGKDFTVPEFYKFDQITLEARAFLSLFETKRTSRDSEKVKHLQTASRLFFDIGHRQLFFSTALTGSERLNTEIALDSLAESEEILAEKTALTDINESSFHFEVAISSHSNLENYSKAKELRNRRTSIRMERTCWICGTRSHGYVTSFKFVYARSDPSYLEFYKKLLTRRQEFIPHLHTDTIYSTGGDNYIEAIDSADVKQNFLERNAQGIYLAVCKACYNVVNELADIIAEKRVAPVRTAVKGLQSEIREIQQAIIAINKSINDLYRSTHSH